MADSAGKDDFWDDDDDEAAELQNSTKPKKLASKASNDFDEALIDAELSEDSDVGQDPKSRKPASTAPGSKPGSSTVSRTPVANAPQHSSPPVAPASGRQTPTHTAAAEEAISMSNSNLSDLSGDIQINNDEQSKATGKLPPSKPPSTSPPQPDARTSTSPAPAVPTSTLSKTKEPPPAASDPASSSHPPSTVGRSPRTSSQEGAQVLATAPVLGSRPGSAVSTHARAPSPSDEQQQLAMTSRPASIVNEPAEAAAEVPSRPPSSAPPPGNELGRHASLRTAQPSPAASVRNAPTLSRPPSATGSAAPAPVSATGRSSLNVSNSYDDGEGGAVAAPVAAAGSRLPSRSASKLSTSYPGELSHEPAKPPSQPVATATTPSASRPGSATASKPGSQVGRAPFNNNSNSNSYAEDFVIDGPLKSASPAQTLRGAPKPQLASEQMRQAVAAAAAQPYEVSFTAQLVNDALGGVADKATGLDLPTPLQLFMAYDRDRSGGVAMDEFARLLFDLDGLEGVPDKTKHAYIDSEFERADLNHDGLISIDEFYLYYYSTLCFKFPVLRTGVNPGADLFNIFVKYCSAGKVHRCQEMASHQFAKLCKECQLMNGRTVTKATVDIIYSRARAEAETLEVKPKPGVYATAKMFYPQFLYALQLLAAKRRSGFQEVVSLIMQNANARPSAGIMDLLVTRRMGPAGGGEGHPPPEEDEHLERPRGLPRVANKMDTLAQARMEREANMALELSRGTSRGSSSGGMALLRARSFRAGPPGAEEGGQQQPNGRYAGVADSAATAAAAGPPQLQPPPNSRSIPFQHLSGSHVAHGHGNDHAGHAHDDYELPDGATASEAQRDKWGIGEKAGVVELPRRGPQALGDAQALLAVSRMDMDVLMMALKRTFERYVLWQGGTSKSAMDKIRFQKCLRDMQVVAERTGCLTARRVDEVYLKVLSPAKSSINFIEFIEALRLVAAELRTSLNDVMGRVVLIAEPVT